MKLFFNKIYFTVIAATLFLGVNSVLAQTPTCAALHPNFTGKCQIGTSCTTGQADTTYSNLCGDGEVCCVKSAGNSSVELQSKAPDNLELQIPLFNFTNASNLAEYIATAFEDILIILVPLAVIMILIGGIQWIQAAGDQGKIGEAKKRITGAFIGLFIGLFSYIILSLVGLNTLKMPPVQYITSIENIPLADGQSAADEDLPAAQQPGGVKQGSQSCFFSTYGNSSSAVEANLVNINFAGQNVKVHKLAQAAFTQASTKITSAGLTAKPTVLTSGWRNNVNNSSRISLHSFGIAIDIEFEKNGNCHPRGSDLDLYHKLKDQYSSDIAQLCAHATEFHCTCSHNPNLIKAMLSSGFRWGAYRSTFDAMHFEWTGNCFGT